MKIHIVQKGDTLWKIAKKYGVNFEELKKMNSQLSNPDMIMPGMKIKVPTSGGSIKKEAPIAGAKKEMPIAHHPKVKEHPIQKPVVQAPIKEAPVMPKKEAPVMPIKEAPKVPYTPPAPQPVVPEIDINNYYMVNMAQMNVQQPPPLPPKPTNILPEVKEVPKPAPIIPKVEAPKPVAPIVESPIESPVQVAPQEYCVPISPILPGPGWCPPPCPPMPCPPLPCPPYDYAPYAQPLPYQPVQGAMYPGMMPMPGQPNPTYFAGVDESSSFMPHMPLTNPMGQNPTAVMGAYNPNVPESQPFGVAPVGVGPGPFAPYPDNCLPGTTILPGQGLGPIAGTPYGQPFVGPYQQPFAGQPLPYQQPFGAQPLPYQQYPMLSGRTDDQLDPSEDQLGMQMPQMPMGGQQQMQMPQMPMMGGQQQIPMQQMPMGGQQHMPMQHMPMQHMPMQQMPMGSQQHMPMQQMPMGSQQHMPMQQMPFESYQQMPFTGQYMPYQQMPQGQQVPYGFQQMPYESSQMPVMPKGVGTSMDVLDGMGMPYYSPHMEQGVMDYDCGCGGPKYLPKAPINPYSQGTPGVYTPPYGSQMAVPPYMNPYGYGTSPGSNRGFDESSEFY